MDFYMNALNLATQCPSGQVVINDAGGGSYCIDKSVLPSLAHPAGGITAPPPKRAQRLEHRIATEQGRWAKQDQRRADILSRQQNLLTKFGGTIAVACARGGTYMDTDGKCHAADGTITAPICPAGYTAAAGGACRIDPLTRGTAGIGMGDLSDFGEKVGGYLIAGIGAYLAYKVFKKLSRKRR